MFSTLWMAGKALLRPPVLYVLLAALAAFAIYGYGEYQHAAGVQVTTDAYEARLKKERDTAEAAVAIQQENQRLLNRSISNSLAEARKMKTAIIERIKEIPVYVTPEDDRRCPVPAAFAKLHDEALATDPGGVAASPARPAGEASPVVLSEMLGTNLLNYAECSYRGRVILGWQRWYRENQQLFADTLKKQEQNSE